MEKAILENKGKSIIDRKNISGKQLLVGNYVEFNPSKNHRGKTRSKGASKLRGLVETAMPASGKSKTLVRIGELQTGSTTSIHPSRPAYVVSTGALPLGRVEKREPRTSVELAPIAEDNANSVESRA